MFKSTNTKIEVQGDPYREPEVNELEERIQELEVEVLSFKKDSEFWRKECSNQKELMVEYIQDRWGWRILIGIVCILPLTISLLNLIPFIKNNQSIFYGSILSGIIFGVVSIARLCHKYG